MFVSVGSNFIDTTLFPANFFLEKNTYFPRTFQSYLLELKSISAPNLVRKAKNKMFSDVRVHYVHDDTSHGGRLTVVRRSA